MLRQHTFLKSVLEKISSEDGLKQVISDLDAVRSHVTSVTNLRVHMAAHVSDLMKQGTSPQKVWVSDFLPDTVKTSADRLGLIRRNIKLPFYY